jgi:hypothetical protein
MKCKLNTDIQKTFETADDVAEYMVDYVDKNAESITFLADVDIADAIMNSIMDTCDYAYLYTNIDMSDTNSVYEVILDEDYGIYVGKVGSSDGEYKIPTDEYIMAHDSVNTGYLYFLHRHEIEFELVDIEEFYDFFEPYYKSDYNEDNEIEIHSSFVMSYTNPSGETILCFT